MLQLTHVAWHTGSEMNCLLDGVAGGRGGETGGSGGGGGSRGGVSGGGGPCGGLGGGLGGGGGGLGTGMGGGAGGCGGDGVSGALGGGGTVAYCTTPERATCIGTHAPGLGASGSPSIQRRKFATVALSAWYEQVITWYASPQLDDGATSACDAAASSLRMDAASGLHRSAAEADVALPPRTSSCRMTYWLPPYAYPGKAGGRGGGNGGGGGLGGGGDAICAASDMASAWLHTPSCLVRSHPQLCVLSDHYKATCAPWLAGAGRQRPAA